MFFLFCGSLVRCRIAFDYFCFYFDFILKAIPRLFFYCDYQIFNKFPSFFVLFIIFHLLFFCFIYPLIFSFHRAVCFLYLFVLHLPRAAFAAFKLISLKLFHACCTTPQFSRFKLYYNPLFSISSYFLDTASSHSLYTFIISTIFLLISGWLLLFSTFCCLIITHW